MPPSVDSESISGISIKTPLRGNITTKVINSSNDQTSQRILREIASSTQVATHILHGSQGVGKTTLLQNVIKKKICKSIFSEGIVWVGFGFNGELNFEQLILLYRSIYAQIYPHDSKQEKISFDEILYYTPKKSPKTREQKEMEKNAMTKARDILGKFLENKKVLLCLDGIEHRDDIEYFTFIREGKVSEIPMRVLITSTHAPSVSNLNRTKLWEIQNLKDDEASKLFMMELSDECTNSLSYSPYLAPAYQACQGSPLILRSLGKLIEAQYNPDDNQFVHKITEKLKSSPTDPSVRAFHILEAVFATSIYGKEYTRVAWRCFAAFTSVFTRPHCARPWVPKGAVTTLFQGIISRIMQVDQIPVDITSDSILNQMTKLGVIIQIDGFDEKKCPRVFYQVPNAIYQNFGQQLMQSRSEKTHRKLHKLLLDEYSTMFSDVNVAFGTNEIDDYMLKWLPFHLIKGEEVSDAILTLQDPSFIGERLKHMGVVAATKRHIEDTERLLSQLTQEEDEAYFLVASYSSLASMLEEDYSEKENGSPERDGDEDFYSIAFWDLSFSAFANHFVKEGYQYLQRAKDFDSSGIFLDADLISLKPLCNVSPQDNLSVARALVKVGSTLACTKKRQESIHIFETGLEKLSTVLDKETLEVARANVYVGEVYYHDLKCYEEALEKTKLGLPTLLKQLGDSHEELFDALILVGKIYAQVGDLETALNILTSIAPKVYGSTAVQVNIKIGQVLLAQNDHKKALAILNKAKKSTYDPDLLKKIDQLVEQSIAETGRYEV